PLSHLTTMGGNPMACAAGIAAFDVLADGVLAHTRATGEYLRERLWALAEEFDVLVDVRGKGLWCAIELSVDANPVVARIQELGVLVGSVLNQSGTVRIMPPLVITTEQIDQFLAVLRTALAEVTA
uniref:aminotransferase class III-fold pyridoxal phosphate-dependent enzyme n=1 Tax=uncultured Aeromicrobium sp. TaxID=337820 RepID=UPI0025FB3CA0